MILTLTPPEVQTMGWKIPESEMPEDGNQYAALPVMPWIWWKANKKAWEIVGLDIEWRRYAFADDGVRILEGEVNGRRD